MTMTVRNRINIGLLALAGLLTACNSTTPVKEAEPATTLTSIVMPDPFGFTITEETQIDGAVRADYERALSLLDEGEVDDAIALLKTVAEAAPGLSAPHIDLAIAYHRLDDLEAAEAHLDQALEINPDHPMALNELGIVYRKTARFYEARRSYEAAINVYPNYHYARRNLGVLCDLYLDDLDCAIENYEAYMATVDNDDEAEGWLRNARFRAGQ
jgi:tetratricopeptide (TPR) repeat protein